MNEMNDELLNRILFSTAEIKAMAYGKRNDKYFFMHSLEQSKIDMKKCFKNLITSKIFVFFVVTLLHLFVQNTSISDERNIYGKLQLSYAYSRKLAEKEKNSRARKAPTNKVKKKKVSASSLKKEEHLQNTEETTGSGHETGASDNVKVTSSGAAKIGDGVKVGNTDTVKTRGDAAKTSGDAAKTSDDAAKTSGDAAKTSDDAATTITDTVAPTSDATTSSNDATTSSSDATASSSDATASSSDATASSSDATASSSDETASSSDATTINGDSTGTSSAATTSGDSTASSGGSTTSREEATTSGGKAKVMRSCLKTATSAKREKRNVRFADPISSEKLFYKDERIRYTEEKEKEDMGNEESDIVSKKKKDEPCFLTF
ncbi:hypothetical protein PCYB_042810 [Plasmodium cynomolgi strain B]|uniref:Uncharacterized protein n=1 Tax=Plasmodium cynomolgi (strain B) TaxID=1120755 RepID=K6V7J3_PLACD|nr:hypothetical protein PCYB_042810 [Plasmodium cynomolgi strain B]GAB65077.1 hypothetical protein PCYB_042810 [Plasmodium cynomolgi strain B]